MVPHLRGAFKRAAVFQIRGDARGAKGVVADARGDAAGFGAALNHRIGVGLGQGAAGELSGRAVVGLEQERLRLGRQARRQNRQDHGADRRTGAPAARQHRHVDRRRLERHSGDFGDDLRLRPHWRGRRHARRGLLPQWQALVGRLHEKGGKRHEMPAHHNLEAYLDAYIEAAGLRDGGKAPLFRSAAGRTGTLTDKPMNRVDVWRMIQRRSAELGMRVKMGCHTFRATGITAYLEAGGTLENAQAMAAHESPRTTKLYDRTGDEITLDEVERITI